MKPIREAVRLVAGLETVTSALTTTLEGPRRYDEFASWGVARVIDRGGRMAERIRVRRLTDQEGQRLQQISGPGSWQVSDAVSTSDGDIWRRRRGITLR